MSCILRISVVSKRDEDQFAQLIRSPAVQAFLDWDRFYDLADNYLLSTAFVYLIRAKQTVMTPFSHFNLMLALYLAHEVEEEDATLRVELVREAFGCYEVNYPCFKLFMKKKDQLWKSMNYNVIVKREESLSVMNRVLRNNYIWRRERCPDRILFVNQRMVDERRKRQGIKGQNWNIIHLAQQIIKQNPQAFRNADQNKENKPVVAKQGSLSEVSDSCHSSAENTDTAQSK